jgi:hypothetical protein
VAHLFSFLCCVFCFVCICPLSCIPTVSGLTILDCLFGVLAVIEERKNLHIVKDPLSFEIWIFHNGQPDCDDDRRSFVAMTSTWEQGNLARPPGFFVGSVLLISLIFYVVLLCFFTF